VLNADTSKEYIGEDGNLQRRAAGEDWLHMIIQQAAGGIRFDACEELILEIDFEITHADIMDTEVGASQFQWIFALRDYASPQNEGFWFNLTLYDDRYTQTMFTGTQMFDSGKDDASGNFIYAPKGEKYLDEPVTAGKKVSISLDIKPLLAEAFASAQSHGALPNAKVENMGLTSQNIGWEVSNIAKVGLTITKLGLKVKD